MASEQEASTSGGEKLLFTLGRRSSISSTRSLLDEKQLSQARFKSQFYPGRTSFGGSSAKVQRLVSSPYGQVKQSSYLMRVKEVDIRRSESPNIEGISNSAKRLLQSMEKITSPVQDALRMSNALSTSRLSLNNSLYEPIRPFRRQSGVLGRSFSGQSSLHASQTGPNLISGERQPQMKWDSSLFNKPSTSSSSRADLEVIDLEAQPSTSMAEIGGKFCGGKIRTKICSKRSGRTDANDDLVPTPELPNVPLPPMKSLPAQFNFMNKMTNNVGHSDSSRASSECGSQSGPGKRSYHEMMDDQYEKEFTFPVPKLIKYALMKIKTNKLQQASATSEPSNKMLKVALNNSALAASASNTSMANHFKPKYDTTSNTITSSSTNTNTEFSRQSTTDALQKSPTKSNLSIFNCVVSEPSKVSLDAGKPVSKSPVKSGTSLFQLTGWECDICLVRNEQSSNKCKSCKAARSSKEQQSELEKIYSSPVNFGYINTKPGSVSAESSPKEENNENISANLINSNSNDSSKLLAEKIIAEKEILLTAAAKTDFLTSKLPNHSSSVDQTNKQPSNNEFKFNLPPAKPESPTKKATIEQPTPIVSLSSTTTSGWGNQFAPPKNSWTCNECFVTNQNESSKCVSCENPNPSVAKSAIQPSATATTASFKFGVPASLDTGAKISNDTAGKNISTSGFNIPSSSTVTIGKSLAPSFTFGSASSTTTTPKSDASEIFRIGSAATSKPAIGSAFGTSTETTNKPIENSFGNKFAPPAGSWTCDACFVPNKADSTLCVSCETPRPGATTQNDSTTNTSIATKPFSFGATMSSTATSAAVKPAEPFKFSSTDGFNFGNSSSTASIATVPAMNATTTTASSISDAATTFQFGQTASSTNIASSTSNSAGFTFGVPSSATINNTTQPSALPAPMFNFTAGANNSATTTTASSSTISSSFLFGGLNSGSSGTPVAQSASSGFTFNAPSSSQSTSSTLPKSSPFQFGQPAANTPSVNTNTNGSTFTFGTSAGITNGGTGTSLFNPGQSGSTTQSMATPAFNFSSGIPPTFNFAGTDPGSQAVFTFNSQPTSGVALTNNPVTGRNIRKAKRRLG